MLDSGKQRERSKIDKKGKQLYNDNIYSKLEHGWELRVPSHVSTC